MGKVIAALILAALSLGLIALSVMTLMARRSADPTPAGTRAPAASPAAKLRPSEAQPGVDAGAGTPNAPCATNRLGMWFEKDGVTYTCKGPAPYRWRA